MIFFTIYSALLHCHPLIVAYVYIGVISGTRFPLTT